MVFKLWTLEVVLVRPEGLPIPKGIKPWGGGCGPAVVWARARRGVSQGVGDANGRLVVEKLLRDAIGVAAMRW